jgi:hypothetical protein
LELAAFFEAARLVDFLADLFADFFAELFVDLAAADLAFACDDVFTAVRDFAVDFFAVFA